MVVVMNIILLVMTTLLKYGTFSTAMDAAHISIEDQGPITKHQMSSLHLDEVAAPCNHAGIILLQFDFDCL